MNKIITTALLGLGLVSAASAQYVYSAGETVLVAGWDFDGLSGTTYGTAGTVTIAPRYADFYSNTGHDSAASTRGSFRVNGTGFSDSWANGATGIAKITSGGNTAGNEAIPTNARTTNIAGNTEFGVQLGARGNLAGVDSAVQLGPNAGVADTFSFKIDASDVSDLSLAFRGRVSGTGLPSGFGLTINWEYATSASGPLQSAGVSTVVTNSTGFDPYSADFSAISGLDAQSEIYLVGTLSRNVAGSYTLLMDNVAVYGTFIPEPGTYAAIAGVAALALAAWRRRRS